MSWNGILPSKSIALVSSPAFARRKGVAGFARVWSAKKMAAVSAAHAESHLRSAFAFIGVNNVAERVTHGKQIKAKAMKPVNLNAYLP